jgi:hypothetical protein
MRRLHARVLAAAALAALTAAGLSGCRPFDRKTFEDDATVRQKVTAIRLDSGNGGLRVEASADATAVTVHRKVDYDGDRPDGTSFHLEDGVLTLSGCGHHCGVDYVVTAPAGLPVTGGTSSGGVTLSGVGAVDVHSSNGSLTVTGAAGPVRLRTTNGSVTVRDVKGGGVDTRTSNGQVTIRVAAPQDITARTSSGDLTVTAPPAGYRISASNTNGHKDVAFTDDPSGRYRLDLSTTNGDLTVARAG